MTEHTKEPWTAVPCPCGQRGCSSAVVEPFVVRTQGAVSMDDARRIVACVNACAGLHTAELERIAALAVTLARVKAMREAFIQIATPKPS